MSPDRAQYLREAEKLLPDIERKESSSIDPSKVHIENVCRRLLERFQETADCRYFTAFYNLSNELIHAFAVRYVSKYPCSLDAMDVANRLYIILFEKLLAPKMEIPLDYLFPWCYRVILNLVREEWRNLKKTKPFAEALAKETSTPSLVDHLIQKEEESSFKSRLQEVLKILYSDKAGLSRRDRRVMRLFYLEGRSMQEISETMGLAKAHVGVILMRARKRIARRLNAEEKPS